jgi:ribonuclease P protein component
MLYTVKTINNNTEKDSKNPLHMVFFVIKKKIFKKAVDRNRVKRRARKAYIDTIKTIKKDISIEFVESFFKNKKIIFFLERDMIQEVYSQITLRMKDDLVQLIKKHTI